MTRKIIQTKDAPAALGPYSQGVVVSGGQTLYTAGQIALDPSSGELVGKGDIAAQTERVLDNLEAILKAADMGFGDVVRCGIYLTNMADFAVVNELYGKRFAVDPPARSTLQAVGLPKGALIEIDATAVREG